MATANNLLKSYLGPYEIKLGFEKGISRRDILFSQNICCCNYILRKSYLCRSLYYNNSSYYYYVLNYCLLTNIPYLPIYLYTLLTYTPYLPIYPLCIVRANICSVMFANKRTKFSMFNLLNWSLLKQPNLINFKAARNWRLLFRKLCVPIL